MGKKAILDIKESDSELKKLLVKQQTLKGEKRLKSLLAIKSGKFETRQELANSFGIHIRTLERWLVKYKDGGIDLMLTDKPKNKTSLLKTWHFFILRLRFALLSLDITSCRVWSCSLGSVDAIRMSSKYIYTLSRSANKLAIALWNSIGNSVIPNGQEFQIYCCFFHVKAVYFRSFGAIGNWWYPDLRSNDVKMLLPLTLFNSDSIVSMIVRSGTSTVFNCRKSRQTLNFLRLPSPPKLFYCQYCDVDWCFTEIF